MILVFRSISVLVMKTAASPLLRYGFSASRGDVRRFSVFYKIHLPLLICFFISLTTYSQSRLPAFPGAEGHGKYATGGRGGRVIYVTNLNDDTNPGSLRYALNQTGARIILFRISGTIQLKSNLGITKGDVTIAGQTAPGDGITLRDYPVDISADNVVIRFLRFRMGDVSNQEADALGGRFHKNIIIDHCSASWSVDECVSFYQNENFTLQWCIVSESLRNSVHDKGAHGYGGIWGGKNASFHHNILAHHDSRNPRLGEYANDPFALTDLVDLRNNVIYNWQGNSCYGGEAMNVNIVNCYYKPGPATTKKDRIIAIDKNTTAGTAVYDTWGKFYINGNYMAGSASATADNWTYGVYPQYHSKYGTVSEAEKLAMRLNTPLDPGEVTTHEAVKAYEKVLDYAGASLTRDSVDKRIIREVRTGTATYMDGGNGSVKGIIDTQSAVGGWPVLNSAPAPSDSDSDGMPDSWETANNLKINDPSDALTSTVDGKYPNLEVYLAGLVSGITANQNKEGITTGSGYLTNPEKRINIWMNNYHNELNISHINKIEKIQIFSLNGILIKTVGNFGSSAKLPMGEILPGIYFARILDETNSVFTGKIVKY